MPRNHRPMDISRLVPYQVVGLLLLVGLGLGCNRSTRPPLGLVHGKVTLDGKPLAGAAIAFLPEGPGRESTASTDNGGHYTLTYIRDVQGAAIGWHRVRISTGDPRSDKPELVPKRFHANTELRRQVVADDNEINFDLPSK